MGSARTRRKNLQKRRKRRLFATLAAEIQASVSTRCDRHGAFFMVEEANWTPEREELELMRNEEQRQRTHDKWEKAVAESVARFAKKKRILAQRQQLVLALRQKMQEAK
ncbi:hypothetical protein PR003_g6957 [Phytophthora rubi]|uniref:Uncharacterized protein n=1 Tax=Phytophthora rubi TaxID=129364 RepID=A0A6A3MZT9_9STRA|nr:hypothetical protein PR002_g6946 [Phytophthora rubi]KAE9041570.1 hypothetical protein PR001_g6558 [Phytophthora rubi]KAE9347411.1 hypothetical protein PR003_g6957 [Phytophthora rubi]